VTAGRLDAEQLARARAFIASCRCQFARSVPDTPHEYTARAWLNVEQQREFDWLVELTEKVGYSGRFCNATWRCVDLPPHKYLGSQSWLGEDAGKPRTMLNRARLNAPGEQLTFAEARAESRRTESP
jgi:hypothetical protein